VVASPHVYNVEIYPKTTVTYGMVDHTIF